MITLLCFIAGFAVALGAVLAWDYRTRRANDARIGWSVWDHAVDVLGDPEDVDTQMPAFAWPKDDHSDAADRCQRALKKLSNEH